ncbi:hypothetical protein Hanom_Chr09g00788011 [Helianthus anomalus]
MLLPHKPSTFSTPSSPLSHHLHITTTSATLHIVATSSPPSPASRRPNPSSLNSKQQQSVICSTKNEDVKKSVIPSTAICHPLNSKQQKMLKNHQISPP